MVFRSLAALGVVTFVAATSAEYYEGDGTSYTLGDVSDGNCNFMSAIPTASTNYAALNNDQWDDLANCGRCAEVSCVDDQCTDQSATAIVQILDRCPECSSGDLDLSPTVFKNITGSDPSRLTIRWRFVDCPNPGTIEVCLKTGSNGYYVAVQPTNTLVGVETVTINGESTTMVDSAYYYLITSTSEVDLTSVKVSITSIEGETVEGTYSLTAGECVDTNKQFTASSSSQTSSQTSQTSTSTSTSTTTSAPASTTATPTATSSTSTSTSTTPASTAASQTQGSSAAEDASYTQETTTAPTSTTATPVSTTAAPVSTTAAPISTTSTPVSTTAAPVSTTATPVSTTATPASTTATPATSTPTTSSPKCRVRSRRD